MIQRMARTIASTINDRDDQRRERVFQRQHAEPEHEGVLREAQNPVRERLRARVGGDARAGLRQVAPGRNGAARRCR